MTELLIRPVVGMPEIAAGSSLGAAIVAAEPDLRDGDVLVVTSKIVSKAEGRLIDAGPDREATRQAAIAAETERVVARRGTLRIVQNRNGLVMAGAGVDASNVSSSTIALLPLDPDASARSLRAEIRALAGVEVAVVVSDSFGRPWRAGVTDVAIGAAGLRALVDYRGQIDGYGNELAVTEVAVADELAAAGDLVKGKLAGVPVAVVRGLGGLVDDPAGASALVRDSAMDMFSLGTAEAYAAGRASASASPAPGLHASAVTLLTGLVTRDGEQESVRQAYLGLLAARDDALLRSCAPGHLTASTVVLSAARTQVLLTLHPRVGAWVQVGGHCEAADVSLLGAARREAHEESGIAGLVFDPQPIDLRVHPITCSLGIPTRHFDVRFVAVADPDAQAVRSSESLDLAWFDVGALPPDVSPEIPALVQVALERVGGG